MKYLRILGFLTGLSLLIYVPIIILTQSHISQTDLEINQPTKIINDYPSVWKNYPMDALLDSWKMKSRECTSWVAWKVYETYQYNVFEWGNASVWPFNANTRGFIVDTLPTINSAAVDTSFVPGHIMWVERLNNDETIHVSQYNKDGQGNFSEADIAIEGLTFIHFINRPVQPLHSI